MNGTRTRSRVSSSPCPARSSSRTKSGATFTIRPGDILLAQDNSGTGHKWKLVGDEPWRRAYVVYENGSDLQFKLANTEEQA